MVGELPGWARTLPRDEVERIGRAIELIEAIDSERALNYLRHLAEVRGHKQRAKAALLLLTKPPPRPRGRPAREVDRPGLIAALARSGGAVRPAARELGMSHSTLLPHAREIPAWAWAYGPRVLEHHAKLLHTSGVLPEVARARGYESVQRPSAPDQAGMLVPIWNVHGRNAWSQIRFDSPRKHRLRYENGPGASAVVDCPPAARPRVLDPEFALYVTESPRKADAAASRGLACVDFPGVRMLRLDDATWDYIGVTGRDVRIVFDSDAGDKPDVGAAEWWLAEYLAGKGAHVVVLRLPDGGLDDYLASGRPIEALPVVTLPYAPPRVPWAPVRRMP